MNVNKKLGRFKQWGRERMGGEVKTTLGDDFKALEAEMNLRHEGLSANHKAMGGYVKTLSNRSEGDDKEKVMPVAYLGTVMQNHGEDFESDSEFGRCLIAMGRTHERVSRIQDSYVVQANATWVESLERQLAQMKEYQSARKKLESRRLAHDTAQGKMQKSKREDFRAEEEARAQKAKFEEANEDVIRRMQDIQEMEGESMADLGEFLEAELNYYARCHEALLQLKKEWPASGAGLSRTSTRSFSPIDEEPQRPDRIRSVRSTASSANHSPARDSDYGNRPNVLRAATSYDTDARPAVSRTSTYDSVTSDPGQALAAHRMLRTASDSLSIRTQKAQLRGRGTDVFDDPSDSPHQSYGTSSPDRSYGERAASPATSVASSAGSGTRKKPPPPPPPSRSTKPPPPPPPMKRSALSSSNMTYA